MYLNWPRIPQRCKCHHHCPPPHPPHPPMPPVIPCPSDCINKMEDEIMKVLEDLEIYPVPKPSIGFFYPPDFLQQIAIPITPNPPSGTGRIGEYLYTAPDNGYVSVIGMGSSATSNVGAQVMLEISGILISTETISTQSLMYFSTEWLPVEKGTEIRVVFMGPDLVDGFFDSVFMKFVPLKKVLI